MSNSANQWGSKEPYYNTFNYGINANKTETSIPSPQVKINSSTSNQDPMNALIGIITNNINSSFSELKDGIKNVKEENEKSNNEIKDKLNYINRSSWVHTLVEPSTMSVIAIFLIISFFITLVLFKRFTGTSMNDVKDYILFLGGGLVGILGGDKIKSKNEKN